MKKSSHRFLLFVQLFFATLVVSQEANASHSMGADLTYRCLGGNTYEITLSFYRDCSGIHADDSAQVNISSSCFGPDSVLLPRIPGTGQEITPICPNDTTTCNGGRFTGIQEYVYRGIITLPGPCTDWTFSYNICCRNNAITNIRQPGNTYMYIYSTLNNVATPSNNSPTFSNKPVPFACLGQQFCFNHGAYDVDGDSLVYSLITPYDSPGLPIRYLAPFSATNPLSSSPAVTFNTVTGDICMTPTALQVTVMAVLVQEYRNGVLIGTVERDIQITVINCNNQLPALTGINGTNNFSETICAGAQSCFTIYSSDADSAQHTFVSWDHSIPGATFTVNPGNRQTGTFCWTPSVADISSNPYCFTVTVHDDNCPYIGSQIYSYCVTVIGITADAGPDVTVGCNSFATLTATASGGGGLYTYLWNTGSTTASITSGAGTYIVTASDGTCTNRDTTIVHASNAAPTVNFSPVNSCIGTFVQFHDLTTISGATISSWYWNFGDGTTSALQNPFHNYSAVGTYPVLLVVQSSSGCLDSMVRPLVVSLDQPTALFLSNNVCSGYPVNFTDQSVSPTTVSNWAWNFGDGVLSTVQNPAHVYPSPGNYLVSLILTNVSGCIDSATQNVIVHPNPVANAGVDTSICYGHLVSLNATGGITYSWIPGNMTTSSVSVSPASSQNFVVTVTDANDCSAVDHVFVTVYPNPVADAGLSQTICSGNPVTLTGSGGGSYLWNPGGATTQQITVVPSTSLMFTLQVTNGFGCQAFDQTFVTVNNSPVSAAGPDQSVCAGTPVTISGTGTGSYSWYPGGDTTTAVTITPGTTTTYILTITNSAGCTDTAHVTVTVNPVPVASFSNTPMICLGDTVHLSDYSVISSGTIYSWSWDFGNNTFSNTENTSVLYTDTGRYHIRLIVVSSDGCRDTNSLVTVVAPVPHVDFTAADVCLHDQVNFVNTTSVIGGEPLYYQWDFGDGNLSVNANPSHGYQVYGSYTSVLVATSNRGCSDTAAHALYVHPLPSADFSNNSVCQNSVVQFHDSSSVPAGAISSWSWIFGDGSTGTGTSPLHTYSFPGLFPVKLIVISDYGCADSIIQLELVHPLPVPDFSGEEICFGDSIHFINLSSIAYGSIVLWRWDFDDQTTGNSFSPVHYYNRPGTYHVRLFVVSDSGCVASLALPASAVVYPLPQAAFVQNTTNVEEVFPFVQFYNQSEVSSSAFWSFGDSTSSYDFSPGHMYPHAGAYDVRMIIMDVNGCKDTAYSKLEVIPVTSIFIPNAFTPNGDGENETFHAYFTNMTDVVTQLFNRWGKKIAEWSDLAGSWDGTFEGKPAPEDVYVYRIAFTDIFGKKDVRIGHVTLVR